MTNQSMSDPTSWPDFRLGNKPPVLQRLIAYDRFGRMARRKRFPDGDLRPGDGPAGPRAARSPRPSPRTFGYIRPVSISTDGGSISECSKRCATASTSSSGRCGPWSSSSFWDSSTSAVRAPTRTTARAQIIARVGGTPILAAEFDRELPGRSLDQLPRAVPGRPDARDAAVPGSAPPGPRRHDQSQARARRGAPAEARGLGNDEVARAVMAYPAFQLNGQFIGREKYEQAALPLRIHAGALRRGAARGPARPQVRRRSCAPRSSCPKRARSVSFRRGTTRPRSSTS